MVTGDEPSSAAPFEAGTSREITDLLSALCQREGGDLGAVLLMPLWISTSLFLACRQPTRITTGLLFVL